eukprot:438787_1
MSNKEIFALIDELILTFNKEYQKQTLSQEYNFSIDLSQWKWRDLNDTEQKDTKIKCRPIIISHLTDYNTNNYHEYNPWIYNETNECLTIDKMWFESIPSFLQNSLKHHFNQTKIIFCSEFKYPHKYVGNNVEIKAYTTYLRGFDYDCWYNNSITNGPKNVKIINITTSMKNDLLHITKQRCIDNNTHSDKYIINYKQYKSLIKLKNILSTYFDGNSEYFIRYGSSSAKHDFKLYPITNEDSAMDYLTKSLKFYQFEYLKKNKQTKLILIPWNHNICGRNEFRMFIYRNTVTGISQQNWYNVYNYNDNELNIVIDTVFEKIKYWRNDIIYDSYVADVWIDFENCNAYLIECNPWGIFGSSGSSLFDWKDHYDVLYGVDKAQFRYVLH